MAPSAPIEFFSVDLKLPSSEIHFTNADTSTISPYLFSTTGDQGLIITQPTSPAPFFSTEVAANDIAAPDSSGNPQAQTLAPLQQLGLLHVTYEVAGDAKGTYQVSLADLGVGTSLVDINGAAVNFATVDGTITVEGTSVVPEPSSLTVIAVAGALLILRNRLARSALPFGLPGGSRRKPSEPCLTLGE
jgi:hypothetical protein